MDDLNLTLSMPNKQSSLIKVPSGNRGQVQFFRLQGRQLPDDDVFFKVAEKPLTSSTFLGGTSMAQVDFFAEVYRVVGKESGSVFVLPTDRILVAKLSLGSRHLCF